MKQYEEAARVQWGSTSAFCEYELKTKNYTKEKWAEANEKMMAIFARFSSCKGSGNGAASVEAQTLVAELQAHITANYYTCTDEILAGLGKLYVDHEGFKRNIDKYGEGTAAFSAEAISLYVKGKE